MRETVSPCKREFMFNASKYEGISGLTECEHEAISNTACKYKRIPYCSLTLTLLP